jgi:glycosyltransferase involved in cell wall biosynthesis
VIPCFNAEHYVGEAIGSALSQTYSPIEVIVIDDGSTDRSLEVIKSFGDRIRWETGPNRGGCAARNRGTELARGELIQFLDADDVLLSHKLERQIPLVAVDEKTLVYCDGEYMDDGPPHPQHVRKRSWDDPVVFMLIGGLPTPAPIHRKYWLTKVGGFREQLPCAQERDLHLRIAATGLRFQRLPEVLYRVRRREGSVSSDSEKVLDQHLAIVLSVFRQLESVGQLNEERRRAFAAFLAKDARAYLGFGNAKQAHCYFDEASRIHEGGGIDDVYGARSRRLRRIFGPRFTELMKRFHRYMSVRQ